MPWGRLDDSLYDHPKLDLLPTDRRLEAVGLWARTISWCNRFLTDGHVPRSRVEKLDGTTELADLLVAAGLFDADATGYRVHDFLEFNDSRATVLERREQDAKRQREWRERRRSKRHGVTDDVTANGDDADVTAGVTPSVTGGVTPGVTGSSRARDVARIPARPDPARPDPSQESLERGSSRAAAKPRRADVQALLDRGWPKVTRAQRKLLDEVLARHDVTGPEFAAEVIRATPPDRDPLAEVMAADSRWQQTQRARADAEEAAWAATKADDRATAGEAMSRVGDAIDSVPWLGQTRDGAA